MPKKKVEIAELDKDKAVELVEEEPIVNVEVVESELTKEEVVEEKPEKSSVAEFKEAVETEVTIVELPKGPAEFTITAPQVKYTREGPQVPLTVATLVNTLPLGKSITIKRVN